jgi:hypothetical protein
MLKYFIHPVSKEKLLISECFELGLLSDFYPAAYLRLCAEQREWKGKPSVTQLLNGSRMEFLKLTSDYAINPSNETYRVIGTRGHSQLEKLTPVTSFSEISIHSDDIKGTADLLERQPNGEWWLTDYKTYGSFRVRKLLALGVKKRVLLDDNGEVQRYKRRTKKKLKGEVKEQYYNIIHWQNGDNWEVAYQLNKYRIELNKYYGIKIKRLKLCIFVRDGGTQAARENNVYEKYYFCDVPVLDKEIVNEYFDKKGRILKNAMKGYNRDKNQPSDQKFSVLKNCPKKCNKEESWNGRRCKDFCPVKKYCDYVELYHKEILPVKLKMIGKMIKILKNKSEGKNEGSCNNGD